MDTFAEWSLKKEETDRRLHSHSYKLIYTGLPAVRGTEDMLHLAAAYTGYTVRGDRASLCGCRPHPLDHGACSIDNVDAACGTTS
eukprot:9160-Eustigmatos_ZCMA.PRE.1